MFAAEKSAFGGLGLGSVAALSWASGLHQFAVAAAAAVGSEGVAGEIDYRACMLAVVVGCQCRAMNLG